jgi:hypothetical protein
VRGEQGVGVRVGVRDGRKRREGLLVELEDWDCSVGIGGGSRSEIISGERARMRRR